MLQIVYWAAHSLSSGSSGSKSCILKWAQLKEKKKKKRWMFSHYGNFATLTLLLVYLEG